jgi:hypothetical protein
MRRKNEGISYSSNLRFVLHGGESSYLFSRCSIPIYLQAFSKIMASMQSTGYVFQMVCLYFCDFRGISQVLNVEMEDNSEILSFMIICVLISGNNCSRLSVGLQHWRGTILERILDIILACCAECI